MVLRKLQRQIIDLLRRGYRRDQMVIRATDVARFHLSQEMQRNEPGLWQRDPNVNTFEGIKIERIEGILITIYPMVPYTAVERLVTPDKDILIRFLDADPRILDELSFQNIPLIPETIYRKKGRAEIIASVKPGF